MQQQLENILNYWIEHTIDDERGGFYGKINSDNIADPLAPKGAVLNARILWSFSAAYSVLKNSLYRTMAERSYQYIQDFFIDRKNGSVYWSLNADGSPLDTKKQMYAQAFTIYGLTAFYTASGKSEALASAIDIYHEIEKYSWHSKSGGYLEAFTEDWKDLSDLRLSDKDANEKKTMNTHLHILEAYTSLYDVWPDVQLRNRLEGLLNIFFTRFIDPETYHLTLFFDEDWNRRSVTISYGHDIEASWLMLKAAESVGDESLIASVRELAVHIARACVQGLDTDGSLIYEYNPETKQPIRKKHWWVQAEALVGFLNAFEVTGEKQFYDKYLKTWEFINNRLVDHGNGEWFWGLDEHNVIMKAEDKAGFWKCPYHNSRACMEVMKRDPSFKPKSF